MPKFNKELSELTTKFEKWLYVIKNLPKLDRMPDVLREDVFEKLFSQAEIAKFTPDEVRSYENSLKYYRDLQNSLDTKFEEGKEVGIEQGIEQGVLTTAKKSLEAGLSIELITEITGLTKEEIEKLKN